MSGLSSHGNLSSPDIPTIPGMTVKIRYEPEWRLNPVGIYLTAIKTMYSLAQGDWNQPIQGGRFVSLDAYDVEIVFLGHEGGDLRSSHVVSALRDTMLDLSPKKLFCQAFTKISLNEKEIGEISIGFTTDQTLEADNEGTTGVNSNDATVNATNLTYPDEIIDPTFSIKITYEIDGHSIPSSFVFLMVLDGMARVAQFDPRAPCHVIHAWDPDLHAVFHLGAADPRPFRLFCGMITRSLYLLFGDIALDKSRFHEMSFHLLWHGQRAGQGSVTSLPLRRPVNSDINAGAS